MNIASYIEHINLNPSLTLADLDRLVEEAVQYGFSEICIPPFWVKRARRETGSKKNNFGYRFQLPFGYPVTETKLDEMSRAIDNRADEIDVVLNISSSKTGLPRIKTEFTKYSKSSHDQNKLLKVILETAYLSSEAGADFVKTSAGFASTGATIENIVMMKKSLPSSVGIKAFSGIKTFQQATSLMDAGTSRTGTSSGITITQSDNIKPNYS